MNRAELGHSLLDCILHIGLFGHVTGHTEDALLQCGMQLLHALNVHICHDDRGSFGMQLSHGFFAEARSTSCDKHYSSLSDTHIAIFTNLINCATSL